MHRNARKTRIRLISYALAAMLVLGGFLWRSEREKAVCRRYIEAGWERAFASLSSDMTQIDTALKKLRLSSSPALVGQAASEVWSRAEDAQQSLSQLPFSGWLLEDTAAYLGRLGDYALALSRSAWREGLSSWLWGCCCPRPSSGPFARRRRSCPRRWCICGSTC